MGFRLARLAGTRSAAAAGVDGVFVPNQHMAPLNAVALKASAGTATRVPIARVNDVPALLKQLKERSYWVIGAAGILLFEAARPRMGPAPGTEA